VAKEKVSDKIVEIQKNIFISCGIDYFSAGAVADCS
jgi:hypothetical protein